MVVERGERRALTAQFHVSRAEIPDHRTAKRHCQRVTVTDLMRAAPLRFMRERLTVKTNEIDITKGRQQRLVAAHYHLTGCRNVIVGP